ncbi:MAG: zinc ribbon domain-containing protein [Desulfobacteraceae bacterium]|nr:MAG: zinc ribbon domain-containing protein [Desulfobacteraceae bacterium]
MPIYEYECTKCGAIEEAFQRFSDKPLKKCRHCSGKLHKLISHSAFHLKGTGWYVTDYAGKSQPSESKPKESSEAHKSTSESTASTKSTEGSAKKSTKRSD